MAALAGALVMAGCADTQFLKAASEYSAAENASTQSLATIRTSLARACRSKAMTLYLQAHIEPSPDAAKSWATWLATENATKTMSWEKYCGEVEATAEVAQDVLKILDAYASAIKALADKADYDGSDLSSIATSASTVAQTLNAGDEVSTVIKGAGGPVQSLATFLAQSYASDKLKDAVREADPHVSALTTVLSKYLTAVKAMIDASRKARRDTIELLEAKLVAAPRPDAEKVLAFYRFAEREDAGVRAAENVVDGYIKVMGDLQAANSSLVTAANAKDHEAAKAVLGLVVDILGDLADLKASLSQDGSGG